MSENPTRIGVPVDPHSGIELVHLPPEVWHCFRWPDYQRSPNKARVNKIAAGLREGYQPSPITVHENGAFLEVVDGGHRVHAYITNLRQHGIAAPILAVLYRHGTITANRTFIRENTKLRMNPNHIIRADDDSPACKALRSFGQPDNLFGDYGDIDNWPIKPLTLIKAALILGSKGRDLVISRLAYLSVSEAIAMLDARIGLPARHPLSRIVSLVKYEMELWGDQGRHLVNFAVLGFAYFLVKNSPRFFAEAGLSIKTTRLTVSEKRGAREFQHLAKSDFGKLQALKTRWEYMGDLLYINAPRDPVKVAIEINAHFWKGKPMHQRLWRPEDSL